MKAPDALANAEVVDENENAVRVAELWRARPVVIHFVRHFG